MRNIVNLNSFSAVGPNQVANVVLEPGVTYDAIYLESADNADIEWINLKLNGEDILPRLTVAEIDAIQNRSGYVPVDHDGEYVQLPIQMRDAVYDGTQRMTGLVVGPGDNCVLDVKIKAGAAAPTLQGFAETRGFPGARSIVRKFERATIPASGAGKIDYTSIMRGARLYRAYFACNQNIKSLEIIRDSVKVFEVTDDRNRFINGCYGIDSAVDDAAGFKFVFDPVREGFPLKDAMSTQANYLNFKLEVDDAGNIEALFERHMPMPANWESKQVTAKGGRSTVGRR